MPIKNTQITAFFEDADNMAIEHDVMVIFQGEGISNVDYLEIFDKYFLEQLTDNLKIYDGQINVGGTMVTTPDFMFGVKLQMRLEYASNLV